MAPVPRLHCPIQATIVATVRERRGFREGWCTLPETSTVGQVPLPLPPQSSYLVKFMVAAKLHKSEPPTHMSVSGGS